ncbi:uncharacterized protein [Chironomus tepperi]|uniref:uncharacterized protein n=1 Tax=Chironomus tepperi TaxID=113505 RepID=UPI00391F719F
MNFKLLLTFCLTIAVSLAFEKLPPEDEDKIVKNYFQNFPKVRAGRAASLKNAKDNILKHFYEAQNHNEKFRNGDESYEMELNELSAFSDEALAETRLGFVDQPGSDSPQANSTIISQIFRTKRSNIPEYWNWAEHGVVQPVQDQGSCGSCYAFAAIGVIESSMCRYHNICVKLSEQEAMECTNGCRGGWDTSVYDYTKSHGGCTASLNYGYLGYVQNQCNTHTRSRIPYSSTYEYKILPKNAEEIRQFLFSYGPLFVAFDVYNNLFSYSSGILSTTPGTRAGGHAVLLVGYGTSNGTPYWILKNSWGPRWGEKGYFRVIRGVNFARIESWKVSFAWTK